MSGNVELVKPESDEENDDFVSVARVGDIPDGEGRAFEVAGRMIAVFRVGQEHHAMDDFCPHQGASLAGGYVDGCTIACPWHHWRFSIRDGGWLDNPKIKVDTFTVRVVGDEIRVRKRPN